MDYIDLGGLPAGVASCSHGAQGSVQRCARSGALFASAGVWFATNVLGSTDLSADAHFRIYAEGGWQAFLQGKLLGPFFRLSELLTTSRFQRVLGMFLVGLWVGRHGIQADPAAHKPLLRQLVVWGLPIGLAANTVVAG